MSEQPPVGVKSRGRKAATTSSAVATVVPDLEPSLDPSEGSVEISAVLTGNSPPIKISETTIHRLTDVFKMLADSNRLKIVLALGQQGRLHVTALCALLGQSQPAVSHHLTLMRMVGLVGYDRVGKNNYYFLASDHIRDLLEQFFADSGNGHKAIQFEDFALAFRRK